jgi:dual specificity MAP kinase phosphatase
MNTSVKLSRAERYANRCQKLSEQISITVLCEIPVTRKNKKSSTFDIFLGGKAAARDQQTLDERNIKYILNAADNVKNYFTESSGIKYLNLNLRDGNVRGINDSHFRLAAAFVDKAKSNGDGNVLIHCKAGANRSATIAIACLCKVNNSTLDEEYNRLVKMIHNQIAPVNLEALINWYKKSMPTDNLHYPTQAMKSNQLKLKKFTREYIEFMKDIPIESVEKKKPSISNNNSNNNKRKRELISSTPKITTRHSSDQPKIQSLVAGRKKRKIR